MKLAGRAAPIVLLPENCFAVASLGKRRREKKRVKNGTIQRVMSRFDELECYVNATKLNITCNYIVARFAVRPPCSFQRIIIILNKRREKLNARNVTFE